MTSDEKKTTKTFVLKPILVGGKKIFFRLEPDFSRKIEKKKKAKSIQKKN